MGIVKCKLCGNLYNETGTIFCYSCSKKSEEYFREVREYLYENPDASAAEIVEATEIPEKLLVYFLREGRLEMRHADGSLRCEQCGAGIATGKLCGTCQAKIEKRLGANANTQRLARAAEDTKRKEEEQKYGSPGTKRSYMHRNSK